MWRTLGGVGKTKCVLPTLPVKSSLFWRASVRGSYKVLESKYKPVAHNHKAFLAKARKRKGFAEAYNALELEYTVASQMLKARARAGLTQDAVAERMGTTKSAISRLDSAGKHAPSLATLKRYAHAVGCEIQVKLVPQKVA